jgi:hypothetical protein
MLYNNKMNVKKIKVIDIRDKLSRKQQFNAEHDNFLEGEDIIQDVIEEEEEGDEQGVIEHDYDSEKQGGFNNEGDEEEEEEEEEDDEEEEGEGEEGDQDGGASVASTTSTTRMLSEDPLFLVLSEYLVNSKGENIVTVLDKINTNLSKLLKYLKD